MGICVKCTVELPDDKFLCPDCFVKLNASYGNTKGRYDLILSKKTFCPKCHECVFLLSKYDFSGPSFYICFKCQTVAQVGVGPVSKQES